MSRVEHIGDATLYLGDAQEIVPSLSGVDLVVTSPPYNQLDCINRAPTGVWGKSDFGKGFVDNWQAEGYADALPEPEYQTEQNTLFASTTGFSRTTKHGAPSPAPRSPRRRSGDDE